ncbi:MAG: ParB/RepB/Spo0J family partition protein [Gammaproteobacteria bacterium]
MAESLTLLDPKKLHRNPDNPRLIFRQDELNALADSIAKQGILVPLTVYRDHGKFYLLDGERRWRCAIKIGHKSVPVIIQPKPDKLQNIMMMFAIHNARKDWDPLPTALKLQDLGNIFLKSRKRKPTEQELADLASMPRGEIRRLRKLLALPKQYRTMLMQELEKPKQEQELTVDHVLEATKGVEALRKRGIIDVRQEEKLRHAVIQKFRKKIIKNTVAPRLLSKIARAVQREELSLKEARVISAKLVDDPNYSIDQAYHDSAEQVEMSHTLTQLLDRVTKALKNYQDKGVKPNEELLKAIVKLKKALNEF